MIQYWHYYVEEYYSDWSRCLLCGLWLCNDQPDLWRLLLNDIVPHVIIIVWPCTDSVKKYGSENDYRPILMNIIVVDDDDDWKKMMQY